jgi:outer membrane protein OmpA-like peptidoglycan-associated protein
MLEEAQASYAAARNDPQVVNNAPLELNQAGQALLKAEQEFRGDADEDQVTHQAYLAKQQVAIANEAAREKAAQKTIEEATARRQSVLLEARNRELQMTRQQQLQAEQRAQQLSEEQTRMREEQMQQRLTQETERAQQLESQLAQMQEMKPQETERGIVLTLTDVLFDLDKSTLKPGAERTLDKLARLLKESPERTLLVEGFTDSTGPEEYNQKLSEERAQAVRDALVGLGINPERIRTRGYGENFPVASNENPGGRQLNRRVEIVISRSEDAVSRR